MPFDKLFFNVVEDARIGAVNPVVHAACLSTACHIEAFAGNGEFGFNLKDSRFSTVMGLINYYRILSTGQRLFIEPLHHLLLSCWCDFKSARFGLYGLGQFDFEYPVVQSGANIVAINHLPAPAV